MRGARVLVRAYGMRPFVGQVFSEGQRGLRVARSDVDLNRSDVQAAGIPWEDAFEYDPELVRQLEAASGNTVELAALWETAAPLRRN